jgi:PAS domain S-box-containing protein
MPTSTIRIAALATAFCLVANSACAQSSQITAPITSLTEWEFRWTGPNAKALENGDGWTTLSHWGRWTGRKSHQELWLRARLPSELPSNPVLFLERIPAGLEIFVDEKLVFVAGTFEDPNGFWFRDSGRHRLVKLPPDAAGKTVLLRVWDRNGLNVSLSRPLLGTPEELVLAHFRANTAYGMLGILFMFGGLICVTLSSLIGPPRSWLFLGLLALSFGWISLERIGVFSLTVDWPYIRTIGTQLSLFSFGIWLTASLSELIAAPDLALWMRRLSYAHVVGFAVALMLHLARLVHPEEVLLYGLPLQIASILASGVILLAAWRRGSKGALTLLIASIPLGISIIGGAAASLFFSRSNLTLALPIGLAFFLTALAVRLVRRTVDAFESQVAGAALKHSEARFRALTENSADVVFLLDSAGRFLFASPACFAATGCQPAELYGTTLFDRIHADDHAEVRTRFEALSHGSGTDTILEYRYLHADGSWRVHEACASNRLAEFDVAGVVVNIRDVTRRRQDEQNLRESESRLRAVVGALPFDFWAMDSSGRYILQDSGSMQSWRNVIGKRPEDLGVPPATLAVWQANNRRALAGEVVNEEVRLEVAGEPRHFLNIVAPILDSNRVCGIIGLNIDITERKVSQERQRILEAEQAALLGRFRMIIEHMPIGCILMDEQLRFTLWNPAAERIFGYRFDEVAGKQPFGVIVSPTLQPLIEERFRRLMVGEKVQGTNDNLTKTGRAIQCQWQGIPLNDAAGLFVGALAMCQDVTEQRALEVRIQQNQKLESLGLLAGGIAHDFNNLLVGILGNTNVALSDLPPDSPTRAILADAEKAALHAADLCKQLLAYAGKGKFVLRPIDLNEIVSGMSQLLELGKSRQVTLRLILGEQLPAIEADPTQLRQVVMNLIINAAEAIGDRAGLITVTTGTMTCDQAYLTESNLDESLPPGEYVFVEVSDTGCGMSDEVRGSIFDPFFSTKFTGRGLGLAAVLGIVRSHRGAIKVDSEPGRGSTFRVLFPACTAAAIDLTPTRQLPAEWHGSGLVLVIDDDDIVRTVAQRVFERAGFTVQTAASGQQGLEFFRQHAVEIRLVLLDMTMPGLSGEQTIHELQALRSDVKILVSSGFSEDEAQNRLADNGVASFIKKPWRGAELLAKARELLDHRDTK